MHRRDGRHQRLTASSRQVTDPPPGGYLPVPNDADRFCSELNSWLHEERGA